MKKIRNQNIIIFSSIDWSDQYQLHHQLTNSLLKQNNKILFVENSGVRSPRIRDVSRIKSRAINWIRSRKGFSKLNENLTLFSPIIIPFPYNKLAIYFNNFFFTNKILNFINKQYFSNPIIISFLPTPLIFNCTKKIKYKLLVYYCANNMSQGSSGALLLKNYEKKFASKSDLIITISNNLEKKFKSIGLKNVSKINLGIDYYKFQLARKKKLVHNEIKKIKKPIIGYIGGISNVIDQGLLKDAIIRFPKINFVFIGPIYVNISKIEKYKNVYFLGKKNHDDIPYFLKRFDLGIIPYKINKFTQSVYVSKLCEYLAMGIPVASSGIFEIVNFNKENNGVINIYKKKADFLNLIDNFVKKEFKYQYLEKKFFFKIAKKNTWSKKFKIFEIKLLKTKKLIFY